MLRAIIESGRTDIEVVAINDLSEHNTLVHLTRFDSTFGRFPEPVTLETIKADRRLAVDGYRALDRA